MEAPIWDHSRSIFLMLPAASASVLQGGQPGMESQNLLSATSPGWCGAMGLPSVSAFLTEY